MDKVGTVIICCFGEVPPPQPILKQMLTGSSTRLNSQFRLTYNMILNLLRVEEMSVESMIKRSFSEFATQRALTANEYPQLLAKGKRALEKIEEEAKGQPRIGVEDIEDYYDSCTAVRCSNLRILEGIKTEDLASYEDIFTKGRIVLVTSPRKIGVVRAPAIVVKCRSPKRSVLGAAKGEGSVKRYPLVCLVLLPASYTRDAEDIDSSVKPGNIGYIGSARHRFYVLTELSNEDILLVGSSKCKSGLDSVFKEENPATRGDFPTGDRAFANPFAGMKMRAKGGDHNDTGETSVSKYDAEIDQSLDILLAVEKEETEGPGAPILDLKASLNRGDDAIYLRREFEDLEMKISQMRSFPTHGHPNLESHYRQIDRRESLRQKVETLEHLLSNESLQLFPDFLQRKAVLHELGYVDSNDTVCIKGRVACETNTCEELIVTEMVFEGLLNDLEPPEIVAVLSALIFQERKDEDFDVEVPEQIVDCCNKMKKIAINLGELQRSKGLNIDPGEYCDETLKFGLVHVVYEWALGVPFQKICELTDVQEGSIVRTITRLDELCREVRNCARVVGNPTLYRKLEAASAVSSRLHRSWHCLTLFPVQAIKRDIVFASSLYVS